VRNRREKGKGEEGMTEWVQNGYKMGIEWAQVNGNREHILKTETKKGRKEKLN